MFDRIDATTGVNSNLAVLNGRVYLLDKLSDAWLALELAIANNAKHKTLVAMGELVGAGWSRSDAQYYLLAAAGWTGNIANPANTQTTAA